MKRILIKLNNVLLPLILIGLFTTVTLTTGCEKSSNNVKPQPAVKTSPSPKKSSTSVTAGGGNFSKAVESFKSKNFKEAIDYYNRAALEEPDNPEVYAGRSRSYYETGDFDSALKDAEKALSLKDTPRYRAAIGDLYIVKFNWDRAIEEYNKVLEKEQSEANWYFSRGIAYTQKKMYEKALADFNKALELDPSVDGYYEDRGYALYNLGRYDEALRDFNRAAELAPDNFSNRYAIGTVYAEKGNHEKAVEYFNLSEKIFKERKKGYLDNNPTLRNLLEAKIYYERGIVYQETGDFRKAAADIRKAYKVGKDSLKIDHNFGFRINYSLGEILEEEGKKEESGKFFNRALEFGMKKIEADDFIEWANALAATGREKEALENYEKALKMDSENPWALFGKGRVLLESGDKTAARPLLEKALNRAEREELSNLIPKIKKYLEQ